MRSYQVTRFDAAPTLLDEPVPTPGPGMIRVQIMACGLNFADLLMCQGKYQDTPEPPFTLGMEVAGVVDALGPDTDGPAVGTRVAVFGGQGGSAAGRTRISTSACTALGPRAPNCRSSPPF